ncbi:hypothetical protein SUGI_0849950 [Cryptomeria japonica]|nr:hypothetical protein SUGI_0849950 [Cryptomeria japonica]
MELDMEYEAPDFSEFEVSPYPKSPDLIFPKPIEVYYKITPGEHLKTGLLAAAVFSFIFLIAKDAHKAFARRAHWIPCDFLVLSAFSIQLLNLLSAQNEALGTSNSHEKFSIKDAAQSSSNADLWKEFLMIHNSRTIMCVLVAYVMPGMANRGPEHSWGRLVALAISIIHHVMSELYIEDHSGDVFPNFLRLWPRQNGLSDPLYFTLAATISFCFVMLVLLLGSADIAGRGIERIKAKKISLVLRGEGEFSSGLASKTHEAHSRHHPHHHSFWRGEDGHAVRGEKVEEEQHRRHCHYCWRTVEDSVLKAWIIVRAYSLQHVIARSALTSSAAVIVTIQILTTIVGGLAKGATGNHLVKDRLFKFITTVMQCVFILIGWSIIIWRWASAVAHYRRRENESWRSILRVEDFWIRHLRELQQAKETRLRQARSLNTQIEQLVAKEQITLSVSNTSLSIMIAVQWFLVSFSKVFWFVSLVLMQNRLLVKLLSLMFPNQEMYVFEDYPKYRKILEDVQMLGETPESLWVANRKSIETARSLIIQGDQDGEYNCDHLVEFLIHKRTEQGLGLSCLEPYKPQTRLNFLCKKRPSEDISDVENQQPRGGNASLTVDVSTKSRKMTAVSLISIIVYLSPVYAKVNKADSSDPQDPLPKAIKGCLDAYSQAWEIIDFVEEADTEADRIISEGADSVEEADVRDDRLLGEAADRYFQALQKKIEEKYFSASKTKQATPDSVPAALEKLKTESKRKTELSRKENIMVRLIHALSTKKGKEKEEKEQGHSNGWKGDDSIDWLAAASGSAVYKLCNSIECDDRTDVNELIKELERCLADIINECLEKVQRLLLVNSRKWALRGDEKRMAKALYTAGKAKAIMDKFPGNEHALVSNH